MRDRATRRSWVALIVVGLLSGCGGPPAHPPTEEPITTVPVKQGGTDLAEVVGEEAGPPAPEPPAVSSVSIEPSRATLLPDDEGLQFLVSTEGEQGGTADLTAEVSWRVEPKGVVEIGPGGYARAIGPGQATVTAIAPDGSEATAELVVDGSSDRPWNFAVDVVPIFTRFGCNGGGCHGKATGQNGFHLSLFGYDPSRDHQALTRDSGGRRLALLDPEFSLLLRKASGRVPHGGGRALPVDSDSYRTLLDWIADGAPERRGSGHGEIVAVEVHPQDVRLDAPGPQQLRVVARFADGHERDVTRLSRFDVKDDTTASVDEYGRAELLRRSETDLIVRYKTAVISSRLATLINPELEFDFDSLPRRNLIDEHLFARLESLKVPPSPPSDDATFLRRATLDLTGQQPRPDEIRAFLEDEDPEKRAKLVDRLMQEPLFVDFWNNKIGDLLQISQARFPEGVYRYNDWVEAQVAANRPWDEFVRELLTALGDPSALEGGPVNYALEGQDARERAELTAQRFLGQRFRCAQCHDHPFDVWTQDDYYGLAAFFAKVGRASPRPGQMMNAGLVTVNPDGFITHLRTGEKADPILPGGQAVECSPGDDPRIALADWMTAPDNPYFSRAAANWVWAQFFGRGLAEPADDLSAGNPPVHPELLDALAADFVAHDFDLRHLIRTVATSEAYGLSSTPVPGNEQDTRLFSHQMPRPLSAYQMADALAQATDTELRFSLVRGGGRGTVTTMKAVQVDDPAIASTLLDTFGRCPRVGGCSPVATPTLSLRQALLLIGGSEIDDRIVRFNGYLASLLEFDPTPGEIVENLYLRTLCRKPTEEESEHWSALIESADSIREASEDLFWALLNCREFAFNH
ncbi:DUF1549 and DUF1553 domain-containing protein [Tautonia sociabilis]|uniref:DUF1549 domain-containing protein n=1 Tax=Tautonia sociabilis TaxID=2080755 RepID=A0A432MPZ4_9BACT|nr:DUF1549 and DUF1553 domain-containing protein [Tautonia sociabilis]RUL89502.1 DUF1549 domain-containing protein [Tautonia sociabilis]